MEHEFEKFIATLDLSDRVAIDIGACVGDWTFSLSKFAKRVIAIEPEPKNIINLKRNIQSQNVQIIEAVIAKEDGLRKLYVSNNSGWHSIDEGLVRSHNRDHQENTYIEVNAFRLDTITKDLDVGLIKIDVESAEEEVLRSGIETLEFCHPILILETHPPSDLIAIYNLLKQFDYTIYFENQEVDQLIYMKNFICL